MGFIECSWDTFQTRFYSNDFQENPDLSYLEVAVVYGIEMTDLFV
jgi:hypothetical protein